MRSVATLTLKELRHIFFSPIAYAFLLVFVTFVTFWFFRMFFLYEVVSLAGFFGIFPLAFSILIPGITMRMWAEERRQGTIEFLLTAPLATWHIIIAKFLAGLALLALCLLLTLMVPYTVGRFGNLDPGPVIGGYVGALLLGGAFIAIGMFCSAFTEDQIVSFLVSVVVLFTLVLLGERIIQDEFDPGSWLGAVTQFVSPTKRFESIGRGVVAVRDVYYFLATIALFLYLNARVIDLRRWR